MTRKMMLIAGVAGLALTAPASAEKGGRDNDEKKQQAQAQAQAKQGGAAERPQRQERAERPQRQERQQVQRAERPQRAERQQVERVERPQRAERQMQRMERAERPQRIERQVQRAERPQRIERQQARQVERAQRVERREVRRVERPQRIERQQARQIERTQRVDRPQRVERLQRIERQQARQVERAGQRQIRQEARGNQRELRQARREDRQVVSATPRAERQQSQFNQLVERRDMRPMRDLGEQRISIGERISATAFAPVPAIYASRYNDTPDYYHRYDGDYGTVYRVNRDSNYVSALMPMFGGYSIGDAWPSMYQSSYVPYGYQAQYYDTPNYYYRNDGYGIYQMDGSTQLITALVALLTGQNFGIGQTLPTSFGAYNVPMAYRSNYYDTNDDWYRYGDGYIYQVDPYSRRIEERYPLYADNYMIGQPWPVAYPGYNVPYGYRDAYYDTPQNHYRYANGGIYQVDPTTQLITALVALVSGQQFGIGQAMPAGYNAYNVPFDYRDRYADSDDQWYRYANGNVYRVDPRSGLIEEAFPAYI